MKSQTDKTPSLRYPEFIGSWHDYLLGDYLDFKNGFNAEKSQYGAGKKFINVLDIINESPIVYDSIIGSVRMSETEFKNYQVKYGDILFQRSSETREEVGQSNVYLDRDSAATFGGFVIRGSAKQEYDPLFFHYLLKTDPVRKDITSRSGGSTRYNIGQESLRVVSIVIPTQAEQKKIAMFLSAMDEKIEHLTRKKALLLKYKKGVMQQIFEQKIRFKEDNGNDFPDWQTVSLSEVLDYEQPAKYLVSDTGYSNEYSTPVLTAGKTFVLGYTNETYGVYERHLPVIIFDDFTTATKFVDFRFKVKSSALKILKPQLGINLRFIFEAMQRLKFVPGGHERHWISKFSYLTIKLPDLIEQQKIAAFLSLLDAKIALLTDQLERVTEFKKGLLQQMFV
jgi:type I restriction enzyme S subunit